MIWGQIDSDEQYLKHTRRSCSMLNKLVLPLLLLIFALSSAGCANMGPNQQGGLLLGGAAGGAIGSQFGKGNGRIAGGILGALIGAFVGSSVGSSMDQQDQMNIQNALERQRVGRPYSWTNRNTGYQYAVTPTRTWQDAGYPCREYAVKGNIGGQWQTVYGKACRQPDGSWQAMDGGNNEVVQQSPNYDSGDSGYGGYDAPPPNFNYGRGNHYQRKAEQVCRMGYQKAYRDWQGRLRHQFCRRCNGMETCTNPGR